MFHPKLRRALAAVTLMSAFSLLPVQAAGFGPRAGGDRRSIGASRSSEGCVVSFWSFLAGLLTKAGQAINPDGID